MLNYKLLHAGFLTGELKSSVKMLQTKEFDGIGISQFHGLGYQPAGARPAAAEVWVAFTRLHLCLTGAALCWEKQIKQFAPVSDVQRCFSLLFAAFLAGNTCRDVPWFAFVLEPQRGCGSAGMAPLQLLPSLEENHPSQESHECPTSIHTLSFCFWTGKLVFGS